MNPQIIILLLYAMAIQVSCAQSAPTAVPAQETQPQHRASSHQAPIVAEEEIVITDADLAGSLQLLPGELFKDADGVTWTCIDDCFMRDSDPTYGQWMVLVDGVASVYAVSPIPAASLSLNGTSGDGDNGGRSASSDSGSNTGSRSVGESGGICGGGEGNTGGETDNVGGATQVPNCQTCDNWTRPGFTCSNFTTRSVQAGGMALVQASSFHNCTLPRRNTPSCQGTPQECKLQERMRMQAQRAGQGAPANVGNLTIAEPNNYKQMLSQSMNSSSAGGEGVAFYPAYSAYYPGYSEVSFMPTSESSPSPEVFALTQ